MTVEAKLDQIIAALATLSVPAVDISTLATAAEVADLSTKIDALSAVVGTEPAAAPVSAPDAPPAA